ncbi:30S ribosomal protein S10 [archaeon CG10_big_fil_rev_8_21_14_0_10_43_11]|nr:MAG: 30S ribosomal protein S10 [archaeon CG10_big_fil_rev_8_21_14_0_10_43_11]
MGKAVIKLFSTDVRKLEGVCTEIKDIAKKAGVKLSGPIPLPTKRLKVPVRKSPCGEGRESYETWEMRIHKRLIDLDVNEKALRYVMRIPIPKDVNIEMEIIE